MCAKNKFGYGKNTKEITYNIDKNGCWICTSHKGTGGYPTIRINKKLINLSRFMYEKFIGDIPDGMCACHTCDNPSCINPDHIFIGTKGDNNRDRAKKGRSYNKIKFKAISENNEVFYGDGIVSFSKLHNLSVGDIFMCLSGDRKTHKGWKFEYV